MVSDTSTTAGLCGMEQRGLAGGRVMMDERRMVALSGVVVASTAARPGKGKCSSTALKMDCWQVAAAASCPAGVQVEECAGLWVPHTRQASWLGPQVLDVRFVCEVCLVLGSDYQHPYINWIGVATDVT